MGNPADPLIAWGQKLRAIPGNIVNDVSAPVEYMNQKMHNFTGQYLPFLAPPPVDTSWHDQMVRNANQSFAQQQQPGSMIAARKAKK